MPFEKNKLFRSADEVKRLAERLSTCPEVGRLDDGEHKEAWALAISLADIEESFRTVLDDLLPALCDGTAPKDMNDILFDLGEEFRHILWHILEAPKYYRYLVDDGTHVTSNEGSRET